MKIGALGNEEAGALANLETKLENKTTAEGQNRKNDMKTRFDQIMTRLEVLDMRDSGGENKAEHGYTTWVPKHITLDG